MFQVEKQVDTAKKALVKQFYQYEKEKKKFNLNQVLCDFLLKSHITPNSVTKKSPAELIFGQVPRMRIQLLKPCLLNEAFKTNLPSEEIRKRKFVERQNVLILNKRKGEIYMRWIPGKILKCVSLSSYLVGVNGEVRFVHIDYIKDNKTREEYVKEEYQMRTNATIANNEGTLRLFPYIEVTKNIESNNSDQSNAEECLNPEKVSNEASHGIPSPNSLPSPNTQSPFIRRSKRSIKAPERLNL